MLVPDDLPAFATLTTDEERERKAEATSPGTYNVVVNPESFQHLPEYSDDLDAKSLRADPRRRASLPTSLASSQGREMSVDGAPELDDVPHHSEDPNVVILDRFQDGTRRATLAWKESRSPIGAQVSMSGLEINPPIVEGPVRDDTTRSLMQIAAEGGQDSNLLHHFRVHIWPQLNQVQIQGMAQESSQATNYGVEVLEHAARVFPPVSLQDSFDDGFDHLLSVTFPGARQADDVHQLFHAMMAVAALALAHREGNERLDALQHYQKALPALQSNLRSAGDLSSDGAFLTHFLLLVYEVSPS